MPSILWQIAFSKLATSAYILSYIFFLKYDVNILHQELGCIFFLMNLYRPLTYLDE